MSSTIKYTNELGNEITSQQIKSVSSYSKIFTEYNIPVKKERYENNKLVDTLYYITSQQQLSTILSTNPTVSFNYKYLQNGFKILELLSYENNVLIGKSISVYDGDNEICHRNYKLENKVATTLRTEKYYYDGNGLKYTFDYNADGTCFLITDEQDYQADIYAWGIGDTDYTDFTWTGFEYYQFADPVIPLLK